MYSALKDSSTQYFCKAHNIFAEPDTLNNLNKLIRLRNYFRRRYQRTGLNRYRIFRNVLNNHIKNKVIYIKNQNWNEKFKIVNTKDNSLWRVLKSAKRTRIPSLLFKLN